MRNSSHLTRRLAAIVASAALGAGVLGTGASAQAQAEPVDLNLLGINDFHGRIDADTVQFAGTIEQLRAEAGDASTLVVSAGDNIGASLFASGVQEDEPTLDVLNTLELDASAVGNHEFDRGFADLTDRVIPLADFPILGANVFEASGERALEPYELFDVEGVSVAVVGAVTRETPALVNPDGIEGLTFTEPAEAINDAVAELESLPEPPDVIVASVHEGPPDGSLPLEEAVASSATFDSLVNDTSAAVDAIFLGHTNQIHTYDAPVPGEPDRTRPVLQTGNYGENIGQVQMSVDPDTGEVLTYTQRNVARVETEDDELIAAYDRVAVVDGIVDEALAFAEEIGAEPVAEITADITTAFTDGTRDDRSSESTLGGLVADAVLAEVGSLPIGADLGITNPGGLRDELLYAGEGGENTDAVVTFAEANAVLPFNNTLVSVELTGAQLKDVFEQQWQRDADGNVPSRPYLQLGVSDNVTYTADPTREEGDRITSLIVDGERVDPEGTYRVATFSFLAAGGDNFRAFTEGTSTDTGLVDYEAWIDYLDVNSPVSPDFGRRSLTVEGLAESYAAGEEVSIELPQLDLTSLGSPDNTAVTVELVQGETTTPLGEFDVADGAASPSFTLPDDAEGEAALRIVAQPTETTALTGTFTITGDGGPGGEPGDAKAKVWAKALSLGGRVGDPLFVLTAVRGREGTPTGSVAVTDADGAELGTATLRRGVAVVSVDSTELGRGRHRVTVAYSGDETYAPAERTTTIRLTKARDDGGWPWFPFGKDGHR